MELLKKIKVMNYIEIVEGYLEQCDKLCKELRTSKLILGTFRTEVSNADGIVLKRHLEELVDKYEDSVYRCEKKMWKLGLKISDLSEELGEKFDFESFIWLFGLNFSDNNEENEVDENESLYENLIMNSGNVGHVVRVALIKSEQFVREMMEEED